MNDNIYSELIKLNKIAIKNDDVPVSCIIIKDNTIISKAYNMKNKKKDPLAHAEIIAIRKACKKLNTYNLNDCILYTTLYPCNMCRCVINETRIKKVYYYLEQSKIINDNIEYINVKKDDNVLKKQLQSFFEIKRKL